MVKIYNNESNNNTQSNITNNQNTNQNNTSSQSRQNYVIGDYFSNDPMVKQLNIELKYVLQELSSALKSFELTQKQIELERQKDEYLKEIYKEYSDEHGNLTNPAAFMIKFEEYNEKLNKQLEPIISDLRTLQLQQNELKQIIVSQQAQAQLFSIVSDPTKTSPEAMYYRLQAATSLDRNVHTIAASMAANTLDTYGYYAPPNYANLDYEQHKERIDQLNRLLEKLPREEIISELSDSESYLSRLGNQVLSTTENLMVSQQKALLHHTMQRELNAQFGKTEFEQTVLPVVQNFAETLNIAADAVGPILQRLQNLHLISRDVKHNELSVLTAIASAEKILTRLQTFFQASNFNELFSILGRMERIGGGDASLVLEALGKSTNSAAIVNAIKQGQITSLQQIRQADINLDWQRLVPYISPDINLNPDYYTITGSENINLDREIYKALTPQGITNIIRTLPFMRFDPATIANSNLNYEDQLYLIRQQAKTPEEALIDTFNIYKKYMPHASDNEVALLLAGGDVVKARSILMVRRALLEQSADEAYSAHRLMQFIPSEDIDKMIRLTGYGKNLELEKDFYFKSYLSNLDTEIPTGFFRQIPIWWKGRVAEQNVSSYRFKRQWAGLWGDEDSFEPSIYSLSDVYNKHPLTYTDILYKDIEKQGEEYAREQKYLSAGDINLNKLDSVDFILKIITNSKEFTDILSDLEENPSKLKNFNEASLIELLVKSAQRLYYLGALTREEINELTKFIQTNSVSDIVRKMKRISPHPLIQKILNKSREISFGEVPVKLITENLGIDYSERYENMESLGALAGGALNVALNADMILGGATMIATFNPISMLAGAAFVGAGAMGLFDLPEAVNTGRELVGGLAIGISDYLRGAGIGVAPNQELDVGDFKEFLKTDERSSSEKALIFYTGSLLKAFKDYVRISGAAPYDEAIKKLVIDATMTIITVGSQKKAHKEDPANYAKSTAILLINRLAKKGYTIVDTEQLLTVLSFAIAFAYSDILAPIFTDARQMDFTLSKVSELMDSESGLTFLVKANKPVSWTGFKHWLANIGSTEADMLADFFDRLENLKNAEQSLKFAKGITQTLDFYQFAPKIKSMATEIGNLESRLKSEIETNPELGGISEDNKETIDEFVHAFMRRDFDTVKELLSENSVLMDPRVVEFLKDYGIDPYQIKKIYERYGKSGKLLEAQLDKYLYQAVEHEHNKMAQEYLQTEQYIDMIRSLVYRIKEEEELKEAIQEVLGT